MTINGEGIVPLFLISRFACVNQRAADAISAAIIKRESNPVLLSPYSYARGGGVTATLGSLAHGAVSVLGSFHRSAMNTLSPLDSSTSDWACTLQSARLDGRSVRLFHGSARTQRKFGVPFTSSHSGVHTVVSWVMTPYRLVSEYQNLQERYCDVLGW
jgi:hypothetical protein